MSMSSSSSSRKRNFSSSLVPDMTGSPRSRSFSGLSMLSRRLREEEAEVRELEKASAMALVNHPAKEIFAEEDYLNMKSKMLIPPSNLTTPGFQKLSAVLLEWVNYVLTPRRILVDNIEEDFYDGHVLSELLGELENDHELCEGNVPLTTDQKRQAVQKVLAYFATVYRGTIKWTVDAIMHKDLVQTIHLLVAMARHYQCHIPLPRSVSVSAVFVERKENKMIKESLVAELTHEDEYDGGIATAGDKDVFDRLFEAGPERVREVERALLKFVNKHMSRIDVRLHEFGRIFADGVNLVHLISILNECFVPLNHYHICPVSREQKVNNVKVAFDMVDESVNLPDEVFCTPKMIADGNRKATLRFLYSLFQAYSDMD